MEAPKIGTPHDHDFHDSLLEDIKISNRLDEISIIVSTPNEDGKRYTWKIQFNEILHFEYETNGDGTKQKQPIDIYDIYNLDNSEENNRWKNRLKAKKIEAVKIFHVELASSLFRGWGTKEDLDGINIICRTISIEKHQNEQY